MLNWLRRSFTTARPRAKPSEEPAPTDKTLMMAELHSTPWQTCIAQFYCVTLHQMHMYFGYVPLVPPKKVRRKVGRVRSGALGASSAHFSETTPPASSMSFFN